MFLFYMHWTIFACPKNFFECTTYNNKQKIDVNEFFGWTRENLEEGRKI